MTESQEYDDQMLIEDDGLRCVVKMEPEAREISKRIILLIACLSALCDCLLLSVIVPIIPVYLDVTEIPTTRPQIAANSTSNKTFATVSPSTVIDSSMDLKIGALFASKAFVQIMVNPAAGHLTERVGYSIPLYSGFCVLFVSTLVYGFASGYWFLFVARAIQGLGSSFVLISSLAMLAAAHPDDNERGTAIGIAMGVTGLGVLAGPPFGGLFYSIGGKGLPFFILAGFIFLTFVLVVISQKPVMPKDTVKPTLKDLLSDPYILIASGAVCFCNMSFALLEPTLPIWLLETMDAKKWQIGLIFLPSTGAYLIATPLLGKLGNIIGRWLASLIGLVLVAVSLFVVPVAKTLAVLVAPLFALGFCIGELRPDVIQFIFYLLCFPCSAFSQKGVCAEVQTRQVVILGTSKKTHLALKISSFTSEREGNIWIFSAVCFQSSATSIFFKIFFRHDTNLDKDVEQFKGGPTSERICSRSIFHRGLFLYSVKLIAVFIIDFYRLVSTRYDILSLVTIVKGNLMEVKCAVK